MKKQLTIESTYNGYPIQTSKENDWKSYTDILEKIQELFEYALGRHSQILLIRFDVRYPPSINAHDNSMFQGFIENYRRYLKRHRFDPIYIWSSEVGPQNGRLHHHVSLILNANEIRCMPTMKKAEELWNRALNGPFDWYDKLIRPSFPAKDSRLACSRSIIKRGDLETLNEAVYWISYLAKESSKNLGRGVRMFGCSQI